MNYKNQQARRQGGGSYQPPELLDTSRIVLDKIDAELFSSIARETAVTLADKNNRQKNNKPTQLRKFYDEIVMWENRVSLHPEKFDEFLPFIRMLNAKAAYALGRNLVNKNYVSLLGHCLEQVNDDKTMRNFKLFMEAMMGFYKQERPKD